MPKNKMKTKIFEIEKKQVPKKNGTQQDDKGNRKFKTRN